MHDQLDVIKLLLDADADPYTEDKLGGYVPWWTHCSHIMLTK